ncbi:MAG: HD-GYP domain-containing protein [Armatimonas sp.]
MKSLPVGAQIFFAAVVLDAVLLTVYLPGRGMPEGAQRPWEYLLLIALALFLGSRKIVLFRRQGAEGESAMSIGTTVSFIALFFCGPVSMLVVASASCLASCLFPKRQQGHQIIFNVCLTMLECWASSMCFIWLNGGELTLSFPQSFVSVFGAACAYFLTNTLGVATIVALALQESPWQIWRRDFAFSLVNFLASAATAALAIIMFGERLITVLLLAAPASWMVYQSFQDRVQRIEEVRIASERRADLYLSVIQSLALAVDAKDPYTHRHILRVQRYATAIANRMNIVGNELEGLRTSALLHDIGKLGVPDSVLLKPGRLTDEEFDKIKQHPEIGAAILEPVNFPWPVLPGVKHHHEKWDGSGYPAGLSGEDIPLQARILAVADVYDALTTNRAYRSAWPHEKAAAEIARCSGTHFDAEIVTAFLDVIDNTLAEMERDGLEIPDLPPQQKLAA